MPSRPAITVSTTGAALLVVHLTGSIERTLPAYPALLGGGETNKKEHPGKHTISAAAKILFPTRPITNLRFIIYLHSQLLSPALAHSSLADHARAYY